MIYKDMNKLREIILVVKIKKKVYSYKHKPGNVTSASYGSRKV